MDTSDVRDKLHDLFLIPLTARYREMLRKKLEPTVEEVAFATDYFNQVAKENAAKREPERRKNLQAIQQRLDRADLSEDVRASLQLRKEVLELVLEAGKNGPGKEFAELRLRNWKFQQHLYDTYGGGRVLWQQGGMEAFDATCKWLEAREKAGDFKITDDRLRAKFYSYWTTQYHGPYLIDDSDSIGSEFLHPAWIRESTGKN